MPRAATQLTEETKVVNNEAQGHPTRQTVQPPLTAFTPVQPQLPAWPLSGTAAPLCAATAPQRDSATPSLPHAIVQGGVLDVTGQASTGGKLLHSMHGGIPLPVAGCGEQPQQSNSSTPTDATGMGWWPPGMSMQNLVNLMVSSQMAAQFSPAPSETYNGVQPAQEPINANAGGS